LCSCQVHPLQFPIGLEDFYENGAAISGFLLRQSGANNAIDEVADRLRYSN
jgi:hypothetical protein